MAIDLEITNETKIDFSGSTRLTVKEAVTKDVTSITIDRIIDYVSDRRLSILVKELGNITIAEGDAYDALGDWTRNQLYDILKSKVLSIGVRPLKP